MQWRGEQQQIAVIIDCATDSGKSVCIKAAMGIKENAVKLLSQQLPCLVCRNYPVELLLLCYVTDPYSSRTVCQQLCGPFSTPCGATGNDQKMTHSGVCEVLLFV